jgi:hypothetical protein
MQLRFEMLHVAFKLSDALSEREYVVAGRVVHAFQCFGEPRTTISKPDVDINIFFQVRDSSNEKSLGLPKAR